MTGRDRGQETGDRGLPAGLRMRGYEATDHDRVWALREAGPALDLASVICDYALELA